MEINEYIYVDQARLESYAEQLGTAKKRVKLPTWKAALTLKGPSIERSQTTSLDSRTIHEKAQSVIQQVELASYLPLEYEFPLPAPFAYERHRSRRVVLPGYTLPSGVDVSAATVWLCDDVCVPDGGIRQTFLLEDFRDSEGVDQISPASSATAFSMLLEYAYGTLVGGEKYEMFCRAEIETQHPFPEFQLWHLPDHVANQFHKAIVASDELALLDTLRLLGVSLPAESEVLSIETKEIDTLGDNSVSSFFIDADGMHLIVSVSTNWGLRSKPELRIIRRRDSQLACWFSENAQDVIHKLGGIISPARTIETLYRVRMIDTAESIDPRVDSTRFVVIGYPIFVVESPSEFSSYLTPDTDFVR